MSTTGLSKRIGHGLRFGQAFGQKQLSRQTDTSWSPQYRPDSPAYWVVLRGGDWEEPSVFESEAEVKRFVGKQPTDKHIIQPLIDYIEIFIFCSGASVGIPGRWLWTRRN